MLRLRRDLRLELLDRAVLGDHQLASGGQVLVEAWMAPGSRLIGRTLRQFEFHAHFRTSTPSSTTASWPL